MSNMYRSSVFANVMGTLYAPRGDGRGPTEWAVLEALDEEGNKIPWSETHTKTQFRQPRHINDVCIKVRMRDNIVFREVRHITHSSDEPPGYLIGTAQIIRKGATASGQDIAQAASQSSSVGCVLAIATGVIMLSGLAAGLREIVSFCA